MIEGMWPHALGYKLTVGWDEDAGDDGWAALFGNIQVGDAKRGDWGGAAPSGVSLDSVALSRSKSGSEDLMGDSIAGSVLDEKWMNHGDLRPLVGHAMCAAPKDFL